MKKLPKDAGNPRLGLVRHAILPKMESPPNAS